MTTHTCKVHIDASLFNFQFKEPVYVDVSYAIMGSGSVQVYEIGATPSVLREINGMPEFVRQCEEAAVHNAKLYLVEKENYDADRANDPVAVINEIFSNLESHFT